MTGSAIAAGRRAGRIAAIASVLLLAGCGSPAGVPASPGIAASPAVPCLTTAAASTPRGGGGLPDLALPCFDGSAIVHLGHLPGPAIVNLWASWCPPCRAELPAFQRYAQRARGQVTVIGVDTMDTRRGGGSVIEEFGLTFPVLVDEQGMLLREAADRSVLPVTLFVDRDGRIVHTYHDVALDEARLAGLAERYLAVAVAS